MSCKCSSPSILSSGLEPEGADDFLLFSEFLGALHLEDIMSQLFSLNYVIRSWDILRRYVLRSKKTKTVENLIGNWLVIDRRSIHSRLGMTEKVSVTNGIKTNRHLSQNRTRTWFSKRSMSNRDLYQYVLPWYVRMHIWMDWSLGINHEHCNFILCFLLNFSQAFKDKPADLDSENTERFG